MIGQKRKERLLKHLKEATKFANGFPVPQYISYFTDQTLEGSRFEQGHRCCPISAILGNIVQCYPRGEVHLRGCRHLYRKKIYEISDTKWWNSLTPQTRRAVSIWLNELIEEGYFGKKTQKIQVPIQSS